MNNLIAMNKELKQQFQTSFGKQLEKFRVLQGLSYRQLAQRCDLDHSVISKIEKGEVNIQIGTVLELAKGLKAHPKELFDFKFDLDE
ncbi:helix-turn-helix domain-containing protein [Flavobacterium macrobrachii]|nr:helix-turn-helix transcriptional regulator [Flavobacterium macrobrachii]